MDEYAASSAVCLFFRPGATNPHVCAKWVKPLVPDKPWFCLAGEDCRTEGLRYPQRADSDDDGEVD